MISPIPTKYKGYNFRSRLEARWAVFFDNMKIQYHYEIEGFQLESGLYLPDFYLPQFKMFAEVKPCEFNDREYDHLFNLSKVTGKTCLMLIGPPDFTSYRSVCVRTEDGNNYYDVDASIDNSYYLVSKYFHENNFWYSSEGCYYDEYFTEERYYGDDYINAVYAARGERFNNK